MSKREINETLKLSFPQIAPYHQVGDYLKSLAALKQEQLPSFSSLPEPELQLVVSRKIYNKTKQALIEKREFFREQRKVLQEQWDNLGQLEKRLKENFSNLSNFVKSNEGKRVRARGRKCEDEKLIKKRQQEIEIVQEKMITLEESKNELDEQIRAHLLYEDYLNKAAGNSQSEFKNAEDMVDRYESLVGTRTELGQRQTDTFTNLEKAKIKIAKMSDENHFRILGLNNRLNSLNARYQTAQASALHWERIVWSIKSNVYQKFKDITEVKQACRNIYLVMCKRKDELPKIPEDDLERQFVYIKKTLQELAVVRREALGFSMKTFSSMKVEASEVS